MALCGTIRTEHWQWKQSSRSSARSMLPAHLEKRNREPCCSHTSNDSSEAYIFTFHPLWSSGSCASKVATGLGKLEVEKFEWPGDQTLGLALPGSTHFLPSLDQPVGRRATPHDCAKKVLTGADNNQICSHFGAGLMC